ncbi:ABC transporter ATP-binding protein [Kitasatospora paranensis]|uniref:ABC transporter ATP-binding protein n=1 Tax=Kitasatospora paranensis TaxID=258053 RepID=A0ABW2G6K6_9ACTN
MNEPYAVEDAERGPTALEVQGLGKRYGQNWALKDCSFRLPAGRICALVGPNGAGKSTLMSLVTGMVAPTAGRAEVFGRPLDAPDTRARVGLVAQDKPLYAGFTVAETLRLGRELNGTWDGAKAEEVVAQGRIPLSARVGSLSGGQRTRVCLALALGRLPDLLVLDEPMSDLDPLARHQLTGMLMAEAAERGVTVLMSSHVVAELQDSCDYLVVLAGGGVKLAGDIDEVLDAHRLLVGAETAELPVEAEVVETRHSGRQVTALVRGNIPAPAAWQESRPTLEEVLLAHLRTPDAPTLITAEARPAGLGVAA